MTIEVAGLSSPTNQPPTLHFLNKTPGHSRFTACIAQLTEGDTLLLLENGVLALQHPAMGELLYKLQAVYALQGDVEARGLANIQPQLSDRERIVKYCSMDEVVELTIIHTRIINW